MASKAVGSLRFDLVANASGMVSGLRKARKEMDRTQKAAKRAGSGGGRSGGRGGKFAGMRGIAARFGPQLLAVGIVAGITAKSISKLNKAATESAALIIKSTQALRARAVRGRTINEQRAITAAQADPLARGGAAAQQRMSAAGNVVTSGQVASAVRMTLSQQRLAESMENFSRVVTENWGPGLTKFIDALASFTNGTAKFISDLRTFSRNFSEDIKGAYGFGGQRRAALQQSRMIDALRDQTVANRATGRTSASLTGNLPQAASAAAGSAAEYSFFVRRQSRERNEELDLVREQNILLTDMRDSLRGGRENPTTGERETIVGVE